MFTLTSPYPLLANDPDGRAALRADAARLIPVRMVSPDDAAVVLAYAVPRVGDTVYLRGKTWLVKAVVWDAAPIDHPDRLYAVVTAHLYHADDDSQIAD